MVSLFQIFSVFAKIGAFTIGGGYAMLALIQDKIVNRKWLTEDEFTDIVALAQSAPGLLAVNISIFAGYRLRGVKGSVIATLGSVLPSFIIILAIAIAFTQYMDNPIIERIFKGIRPVVVALIAVPMVNMAKKSMHTWWSWLIMIASLCMTAFLKISPIYILISVIVMSLSITVYNDKRAKEDRK